MPSTGNEISLPVLGEVQSLESLAAYGMRCVYVASKVPTRRSVTSGTLSTPVMMRPVGTLLATFTHLMTFLFPWVGRQKVGCGKVDDCDFSASSQQSSTLPHPATNAAI